MIIDTHCHLDNIKYQNDVDKVIENAVKSGVEYFIIPGADPKDLSKAVELATKYDKIFFAVGIHPYDCENYDEKLLTKYITHPKCVAVGECGLDYYRLPNNPKQKQETIQLQKKVFIDQINLAIKYNKPLIVHIREASNDSKQILLENEASKVGGVLHCFNASKHLLPLSEAGFYFGIGGVVTFKNAKNLVEILPLIPQDKLLIETDAPYLTPHPFRGTRNEPKYTKNIANKIAELLDIKIEKLEQLTTNNANKLFRLFGYQNRTKQ
jgi:TatD DNase family protein